MKRSGTLIGAVAVTALLLSACGSSSGGTPQAATTPAPTSAVVSSAPATTSAAGGGSSEMPSTTAESTVATSSDAPTTEESTSEETTSEETSTDETTTSEDSTDAPTTTLSGTDEATVAWFSVFCGGFSTIMNIPKSDDPATFKKETVDYLRNFGNAMTETSKKLTTLPPPGFDQGSDLAGKVITAFGTAGPTFTAKADELEKSSAATKDEVEKFLSEAQDEFEKISKSVGLENYDFDKATEDAIAKIPACSAIFGG
jgi:hypothetical protein